MSTDHQRLRYFPISFFAVVMGLAGLTIAWAKAHDALDIAFQPNFILEAATTIVFIVLSGFYGIKILRHGDAVRKELAHPVTLSFFPTVSISLVLLSIVYLPIAHNVSTLLWMGGALAHLFFTLYVMNVWIHHQHFEVQHINPAWFIPAVGNVLVPIAGVPLGFLDVSWFFFSIGIVFWIVLLTIIIYRVLFHNPLPDRLMPSFFILIAPPAVGFIAYVMLTGNVDGFARILYFSGLFFTLLLLTQIRRFLRLQFFLSWWAYSFPLAAMTIATMVMFQWTGTAFYRNMSFALLAVVTLLVGFLVVRTALAVVRKQICLPET